MRWWAWATAVATAVGAGCAQIPVETTPLVARERVSEFEMAGRVAANDGTQSVSAAVEWWHRGTDEWRFLSPIGQILATIEAGPTGAVLKAAGREPDAAGSAEELMHRVIGVAPPLDGVVAWVQGAPRDGALVREVDERGRPLRMVDAGWVVEYLEYAGDGPLDRPRRLEISQGDARLRLVIDEWRSLP